LKKKLKFTKFTSFKNTGNHSLFGNKWTQGKWAQAGGKKQSFHVPLFNLGQTVANQTVINAQQQQQMDMQPDQIMQQQAGFAANQAQQPIYSPSDAYIRSHSSIDGQLR
jgi:hypothetical protein